MPNFSSNIKWIARTVSGAVIIIQGAVLSQANLTDPLIWIVPTIFAVILYVAGEIAGNAPTSPPSIVK